MDSRLRVAWVLDWFAYYSAGVHEALAPLVDLFALTREHGFELGLGSEAPGPKRALFPDSTEVWLLRGRQGSPLSLHSALEAKRALSRFGPDVVHIQDHFDWRLLLASMQPGVPRVLTVHDVEPHEGWVDPRSPMQRVVENLVRRSADVLCVHGDVLVSLVERQPWYRGQPIVSVPMGVLAHGFARQPLPKRPTVLFFGRLEYYKGLDILVEAVQMAAGRLPGLRAIIAGEGKAVDSAQALVTNPDLFDWRTGFVPDAEIRGLFGEASIVVLPYREASQSGVIPVAFSNARAVIASRVGGLVHAVEPGTNGLLVQPNDSSLLADAIVEALADREVTQRLSSGALASIHSGGQSSSAVAAAHLSAYRTAIAVGPKGE